MHFSWENLDCFASAIVYVYKMFWTAKHSVGIEIVVLENNASVQMFQHLLKYQLKSVAAKEK